jgi:small-conductance mechanosensitive channel
VAEPQPLIGFSSFGDSALELIVYFWIDTSQTNPVAAKDSAFSLIKNALDKQGIHIPFPIQRVYMHSQN